MSRDPRNKLVQGVKLRGEDKVRRIPVKVVPSETLPRKPDWIRVRIPASAEVTRVKGILREHKLASVCEEASCPNLPECFNHGTATFMIMGDICTRRCPFCDVAHGKPNALDDNEPAQLARLGCTRYAHGKGAVAKLRATRTRAQRRVSRSNDG